eukprot:757875-Hanusia_phi.AAC.4
MPILIRLLLSLLLLFLHTAPPPSNTCHGLPGELALPPAHPPPTSNGPDINSTLPYKIVCGHPGYTRTQVPPVVKPLSNQNKDGEYPTPTLTTLPPIGTPNPCLLTIFK